MLARRLSGGHFRKRKSGTSLSVDLSRFARGTGKQKSGRIIKLRGRIPTPRRYSKRSRVHETVEYVHVYERARARARKPCVRPLFASIQQHAGRKINRLIRKTPKAIDIPIWLCRLLDDGTERKDTFV